MRRINTLSLLAAQIALGNTLNTPLASRIARDFERGDDLEAREERIRQAEAKRDRKRQKRKGAYREFD